MVDPIDTGPPIKTTESSDMKKKTRKKSLPSASSSQRKSSSPKSPEDINNAKNNNATDPETTPRTKQPKGKSVKTQSSITSKRPSPSQVAHRSFRFMVETTSSKDGKSLDESRIQSAIGLVEEKGLSRRVAASMAHISANTLKRRLQGSLPRVEYLEKLKKISSSEEMMIECAIATLIHQGADLKPSGLRTIVALYLSHVGSRPAVNFFSSSDPIKRKYPLEDLTSVRKGWCSRFFKRARFLQLRDGYIRIKDDVPSIINALDIGSEPIDDQQIVLTPELALRGRVSDASKYHRLDHRFMYPNSGRASIRASTLQANEKVYLVDDDNEKESGNNDEDNDENKEPRSSPEKGDKETKNEGENIKEEAEKREDSVQCIVSTTSTGQIFQLSGMPVPLPQQTPDMSRWDSFYDTSGTAQAQEHNRTNSPHALVQEALSKLKDITQTTEYKLVNSIAQKIELDPLQQQPPGSPTDELKPVQVDLSEFLQYLGTIVRLTETTLKTVLDTQVYADFQLVSALETDAEYCLNNILNTTDAQKTAAAPTTEGGSSGSESSSPSSEVAGEIDPSLSATSPRPLAPSPTSSTSSESSVLPSPESQNNEDDLISPDLGILRNEEKTQCLQEMYSKTFTSLRAVLGLVSNVVYDLSTSVTIVADNKVVHKGRVPTNSISSASQLPVSSRPIPVDARFKMSSSAMGKSRSVMTPPDSDQSGKKARVPTTVSSAAVSIALSQQQQQQQAQAAAAAMSKTPTPTGKITGTIRPVVGTISQKLPIPTTPDTPQLDSGFGPVTAQALQVAVAQQQQMQQHVQQQMQIMAQQSQQQFPQQMFVPGLPPGPVLAPVNLGAPPMIPMVSSSSSLSRPGSPEKSKRHRPTDDADSSAEDIQINTMVTTSLPIAMPMPREPESSLPPSPVKPPPSGSPQRVSTPKRVVSRKRSRTNLKGQYAVPNDADEVPPLPDLPNENIGSQQLQQPQVETPVIPQGPMSMDIMSSASSSNIGAHGLGLYTAPGFMPSPDLYSNARFDTSSAFQNFSVTQQQPQQHQHQQQHQQQQSQSGIGTNADTYFISSFTGVPAPAAQLATAGATMFAMDGSEGYGSGVVMSDLHASSPEQQFSLTSPLVSGHTASTDTGAGAGAGGPGGVGGFSEHHQQHQMARAMSTPTLDMTYNLSAQSVPPRVMGLGQMSPVYLNVRSESQQQQLHTIQSGIPGRSAMEMVGLGLLPAGDSDRYMATAAVPTTSADDYVGTSSHALNANLGLAMPRSKSVSGAVPARGANVGDPQQLLVQQHHISPHYRPQQQQQQQQPQQQLQFIFYTPAGGPVAMKNEGSSGSTVSSGAVSDPGSVGVSPGDTRSDSVQSGMSRFGTNSFRRYMPESGGGFHETL